MMMYTETEFNMKTKLNLITKHVIEEKDIKFTSLAHLLNVQTLMESFYELKRGKAPGIDGETLKSYGEHLRERVVDLVERMKSGKYKPQPVKRVYIPKDNGKRRPLGIPTVEDKIVQMGITRILNAIYEPMFRDFSYGFRPDRNCHQALNRLDKSIMNKPVNHIIDADIKGFFDNVDHNWLLRMLKEKIADKNFLKLIEKILKAGIIEEGKLLSSDSGTPQGGILSPALANVYLHYALDLWLDKIVKRSARGYVEEIRYCDDFVILIQYKEEASRIRSMLEKRLSKFNLELSREKTRTIEFGRYAGQNARRKGKKPATFDFLGFTHFSDKTRGGRFKVGRKTKKKKFRQKIKEMNFWLKRVRNQDKIKDWWKKVKSKLRGHYQYYGVSGNYQGIYRFYKMTLKLVLKWINRRSQKKSMTIKQFLEYLEKFPLPKPKIKHNFYTLYNKQGEY